MNSRTLGATAALATIGAIALGVAAAPGQTGHAAATAKRITPEGVGKVELGKTHRRLRQQHLVGPLRHGCELAGPDTRTARLRAPLKGQVNYTATRPRRVTDITIRGGAKARGVGIGATIEQIKDAFPKAKVNHSMEQVFGITLVRIPKNGGGPMRFAVDVDTHKTTLIGVPIIAFCE
jgi:hypothetical protein